MTQLVDPEKGQKEHSYLKNYELSIPSVLKKQIKLAVVSWVKLDFQPDQAGRPSQTRLGWVQFCFSAGLTITSCKDTGSNVALANLQRISTIKQLSS